jgi:modified peptide precursor CbpA
MVKGVPSIGMGLFFFMVFGFRFSVKAKSSYHIGIKAIETTPTSICGHKVPYPSFFNRKLKTAFQSFHPGGRRVNPARPVNHPRKEDMYMKKSESSKVKPISIRYTCAPNGDQVGLSHYLMADAKKAK